MEQAAREAMVQGGLLALLFLFNETHQGIRADRVTVSLSVSDGVAFSDATFFAGDVPVGGWGF